MSTFHSFAIVPAAGRSRRMGQPKLLLPWQGRTVIEHVVSAWNASRVEHVVVVVSPDDLPLAEICRRLPCHLVVPDAPPPEMKDSVGWGLEWIKQHFAPQPADAWLVGPADLPRLSAAVIDAVLAAYDPNQASIVVPRQAGHGGHPVLFPWRLASQAHALAESETLKDLLTRSKVRELDVPDSAAGDLDTPEDYRRLQGT
jgi:molybdenum cofactor cytidylyltransferase